MKKYSVVGNKKKVTMEANMTRLKVVGNGCIIRVAVNSGELEVIGNDCRIEVKENIGVINLVGSNGNVFVTQRCKGDKVQMIGTNCHLMVDGKEKVDTSFKNQLSPFSKELDDVIDSIFTFVMR